MSPPTASGSPPAGWRPPSSVFWCHTIGGGDENRRLANHLDREFPFLFTYLKCPELEATNYRAEQAIRPAAVIRKVWGGNRTATGARTQAILMSVLRTSQQNHVDPLPLLADFCLSACFRKTLHVVVRS